MDNNTSLVSTGEVVRHLEELADAMRSAVDLECRAGEATLAASDAITARNVTQQRHSCSTEAAEALRRRQQSITDARTAQQYQRSTHEPHACIAPEKGGSDAQHLEDGVVEVRAPELCHVELNCVFWDYSVEPLKHYSVGQKYRTAVEFRWNALRLRRCNSSCCTSSNAEHST